MTRHFLIALLITVAFGQSTPSSSPPERFDCLLSDGLGGSTQLSWEKSKLVLVSISRIGDVPNVARKLEPSPQAWERFWKGVDAAGVWKWKTEYPSPIEIYDVEGWSLELRHAGHSVKSHGYNNRPPGFDTFRNAVDQLIKDSRPL